MGQGGLQIRAGLRAGLPAGRLKRLRAGGAARLRAGLRAGLPAGRLKRLRAGGAARLRAGLRAGLFAVLAAMSAAGGGKAAAQEQYFLPMSLFAAKNNPGAGLSQTEELPCAPLLGKSNGTSFYLSHLSHIGFIKENGTYLLSSGFRNNRNALNLHYSYRGFSVLHTQRAGVSFARKFTPELAADISFHYGFGNPIEGNARPQTVQPGISTAFQREKWGISFAYRQTVSLNPKQKKEWNEALSLQIGANCKLYQGLWLGMDITKDIRYPVCVAAALTYLLKESFLLLLQAQVNPVKYKVGFGYYRPRFQAEISCSYQTPLGFESAVGLAVRIGTKQKKEKR